MHGRVLRTSRLTPGLVRVVLGGDGLAGFVMPQVRGGDATDAYVNIAVPPEGAAYGPVFDPREVRDSQSREAWPARRRYTVSSWDTASQELTLDFVVHGEEGVAGPWAARAAEGDVLVLEGPGGGYRPRPDAAAYLLVGDESALPAIAASMQAVPAGRPLTVLLVCDGPDHEIDLPTDADLDLQWRHRDGSGQELLDALRTVDLAWHDVCSFVHGEADEVRALRRHLLVDRGVPRAEMSCSPYWRRTMDDEAWRAVKRDYVAAMEDDA